MEDSEFLKTPTGWCVIQQICLRITEPAENSEVNDKISSQASEVQVRIPKYIVPDIVWSWHCDFDQLVLPYLPWLVLVSQGCGWYHLAPSRAGTTVYHHTHAFQFRRVCKFTRR